LFRSSASSISTGEPIGRRESTTSTPIRSAPIAASTSGRV
jgi:hypothetical protein